MDLSYYEGLCVFSQTYGKCILYLLFFSLRTPAGSEKKTNAIICNWWICVSYFRLSQAHIQLVDFPTAILASRLMPRRCPLYELTLFCLLRCAQKS